MIERKRQADKSEVSRSCYIISVNFEELLIIYFIITVSTRWLHKPRHHKARDGGFPCHSRRRLPRGGADGLVYQDSDGMRQECNEIHSPDIPCRIPQRLLSDSFRQRGGCGLQEAAL